MEMPRAGGSPCLAQRGPLLSLKSTLLSHFPATVRGSGHNMKSGLGAPFLPSTEPMGSGLAVAFIDVVFHQSHHLLKLVLQLGPPGRGVGLQGSHDL